MEDELTYEELKLGEKAKEAYLSGKSLSWINENCPQYLNTNNRAGIAGLNATDLAIAGVLAGVPVLLGGKYGSGKSQLASDFYYYYFGGSKLDGGEGVKIDVNPETNVLDPTFNVYTKYAVKERSGVALPEVELSLNVNALFHWIDEINRTPTQKQNQFYPMLNGYVSHNGKNYDLGREKYRAVVATANLGNGLYQGTFDFDAALRNRFGIVIDFNYAMFEPTIEDRGLISLLTEADPGLKTAPKRDISRRILEANKQIKQDSTKLSLEELAVLWYLEEGLRTCMKNGSKEGENWFEYCRECEHNQDDSSKSLCSLIGVPATRNINATRIYASSLAYLAKLKNPEAKIDGVDLMFKAFELTSAYQPFLNSDILQSYSGHFGRMMADISSRLKDDFRENEKYIIPYFEAAMQGKEVFFVNPDSKLKKSIKKTDKEYKEGVVIVKGDNSKFGGISKLIIEPFNEKRAIGLNWIPAKTGILHGKAKLEDK